MNLGKIIKMQGNLHHFAILCEFLGFGTQKLLNGGQKDSMKS